MNMFKNFLKSKTGDVVTIASLNKRLAETFNKFSGLQVCIEKGHDLGYDNHQKSEKTISILQKCKRCEYVSDWREATKEEIAAIKTLSLKPKLTVSTMLWWFSKN